MRRLILSVACLTIALLFGPGGLASAEDKPLTAPEREQMVRDYVEAYNAHDVIRMVSYLDQDFEWVSVDGQKISLESAGRQAAQEGTAKYLGNCPSCRSTLLWMQSAGSRVVAHERAEWQGAQGPRAQASVSVYEFRGRQMFRVYYFPAEATEPPTVVNPR